MNSKAGPPPCNIDSNNLLRDTRFKVTRTLWIISCCVFKLIKSAGWSKSHMTHINIYLWLQLNTIRLDKRHTVSLWLHKSPRMSRHVATCSRQSASCLSTVEVQGCLFHKCNECSLLNTIRHQVLTYLFRMSLGIHFPILLCQTNRQYLIWWTVSVTQELFTGLHQSWGKAWMHASLNAVDIYNTYYNIVFVLWFQCNLFFDR
jgi:hypothetical protein